MKLEGKVVLVTGSSEGIGQEIAVKLAGEGANIIIDYRSHPEGAEDTLKKVEAAGGKCHLAKDHAPDGYVVQGDLSNINQVRNLIYEGLKHFGQLDILVNNAGLEKRAPFWEVSEADYDLVLNTNLKGAFFAAQSLVQYLIKTKRPGKIINISSVHEELPFPNFAPYCLSKGALKLMTRDLAVELGPYGITINNVAPGAIETPINTKLLNDPEKLNSLLQKIPLSRLGQPKDVASVVAFLASSDADYVTGSTFFVDGGLLWNYHEQ